MTDVDVIAQAHRLKELGLHQEARTLLLGDPRDQARLSELAEIELGLDMKDAAIEHSSAAFGLTPTDPEIIRRHVSVLVRTDRLRAAWELLDDLPEDLAQTPSVRKARFAASAASGLPALAWTAAEPTGRWQIRRGAWWSSGGPIPPLRRWFRKSDLEVLARMRSWSGRLSTVNASEEPAADSVRASVDEYNLRLFRTYRYSKWLYAGEDAIMFAAAVAIGSATAFWLETRLGWHPLLLLQGLLSGLLSLFIVRGMRLAVYQRTVIMITVFWLRSLAITAVLWAVGLALLRPRGTPLFGWPDAIAIGVLAGSALFFSSAGPRRAIGQWVGARTRRIELVLPTAAALDRLEMSLSILESSAHPSPDDRSDLLWYLEYAAISIESGLATKLATLDPRTGARFQEHVERAADAVRDLKLLAAMPDDGSTPILREKLTCLILTLVRGDLANLELAPPRDPEPQAAQHLRTRKERLQDITRGLAVALTPIGTILAVQPALELKEDHYYLAKIIGLVWTFAYGVLSVDPTLREKLTTLGNLFSAVRGEPGAEPPPYPPRDPGARRP